MRCSAKSCNSVANFYIWQRFWFFFLNIFLTEQIVEEEKSFFGIEEVDSSEGGRGFKPRTIVQNLNTLRKIGYLVVYGSDWLEVEFLEKREHPGKKKRRWCCKIDKYAIKTSNVKYKRTQLHNVVWLGSLKSMKRLEGLREGLYSTS